VSLNDLTPRFKLEVKSIEGVLNPKRSDLIVSWFKLERWSWGVLKNRGCGGVFKLGEGVSISILI